MVIDLNEKAASNLSIGRLGPTKMDLLPADIRPLSEIEAYEIQDCLHQILIDSGLGNLVGHKIGCTTSVMQKFLDINNPCAGGIFDSTSHQLSGSFIFDNLVHPGVECEIAVSLKEDLPESDVTYNRESVSFAVEAVMAAIEVVDDRWIDYHSVDTPTLIADDFFGAGCVLGKKVTNWDGFDVSDIVGSMSINGVEVGSGRGVDIMGHPFEALAWLANSLISRGEKLSAGEFVLLGSLVETKWVDRGDVVTINQPNIGTASALFI